MSRLDPQGRWTTYTTADGLAFDYVQAIVQAADDRLWIGTGGGVNRYDPALDAGH